MSHHVIAKAEHEGVIISELSRAAGNPMGRVIYIAMDCTEWDALCSGDGSGDFFYRDDIIEALSFLDQEDFTGLWGCSWHDWEPRREIEFLSRIIDDMNRTGDDRVWIQFT